MKENERTLPPSTEPFDAEEGYFPPSLCCLFCVYVCVCVCVRVCVCVCVCVCMFCRFPSACVCNSSAMCIAISMGVYYPGVKRLRACMKYKKQSRASDHQSLNCSKGNHKHPELTPGTFCWTCPHGIALGFVRVCICAAFMLMREIDSRTCTFAGST